jgi:hypothetical protein
MLIESAVFAGRVAVITASTLVGIKLGWKLADAVSPAVDRAADAVIGAAVGVATVVALASKACLQKKAAQE